MSEQLTEPLGMCDRHGAQPYPCPQCLAPVEPQEISTAHAPAWWEMSEPPPELAPRYCPWCGAEIAKWGHDDSCDRPKGVELVWKEGE